MMAKFKDMWFKQKSRGPFRQWVFWSTLVFLVIICVNKKDNLIRWIQAGFTLKRQEKQIELYIEQNQALDRKIKSLSTDRDSLETFARENFYFSAPGEDVYIIDE